MSQNQSLPLGAPAAVPLHGLDGTNPLGFLAALGTLCVLADADREATLALAWTASDCTWVPSIQGFTGGKGRLAETLAGQLKCPFPPDEQRDQKRADTQAAHDEKKRELREAMESLKRTGLRGNERKAAEEKQLSPIRDKLAELRGKWLKALRESVPSPELSLGKHLNASCSELRETMQLGLEGASVTDRVAVDLLSAFGSDACGQPKTGQMQATPFCFTTGSGRQWFLDTIRQLMGRVDAKRLEDALFVRAEPSDEKLSMRWNPQEDRRYSVMWSDPTASGNEPKTNWAINLLGYRGLQLVSSAPNFGGLRTTGWRSDPEPAWRWPIWNGGLPIDVIRSLLSHPLLVTQAPRRNRLSAIGVTALFESSRVEVGSPPNCKINFAPAYQVA
jgi:hypothetical protein